VLPGCQFNGRLYSQNWSTRSYSYVADLLCESLSLNKALYIDSIKIIGIKNSVIVSILAEKIISEIGIIGENPKTAMRRIF